MKNLIWIGAAVAMLFGARAADACDEGHQTAQQQQEQKPQKKVAKKTAKKAAAKPALAQNEKR